MSRVPSANDPVPDPVPNTSQEADAAPQPYNSAQASLRYRCSCGHDIEIQAGIETCPECGHRLPRSLGNDPALTVSFCSLQLDATTDLSPENLQLRSAASNPVWANPAWASGSEPNRLQRESNTSATRSPKTLRSGERLGHFVLQEPLGQGGMGAVYRALDTSLQRFVAVKVLRDSNEGSSGTTARHTDRLRQEAVSQARLNHPRVVTIYYVGREGEEPFLAMELLPGPTLQQRLHTGPLPYDEMIEYAMQVTDALEAADQCGMVHGDIKPSNLLMSGPGNIKLSDFGLARRSGSSSVDGAISGTPNYIAPELLDGEAPNLRTDMYALGVTLFELAFGRRPFELSGDTLRTQLLTHRTAVIQFPQKWPSEIPEPFRDVLNKLMAKKPEDRYPSYAQLRQDLRAVCPIGSTLAGVPARMIAWMTDHTWISVMQIPVLIIFAILEAGLLAESNEWFGVGYQAASQKFFIELLESLLYASLLLAPLFTIWWELRRYRTPGRYLMQIRVVDKYGLPPSRRIVVMRNLLRFMPVWISVVSVLLGYWGLGLLSTLAGISIPVGLLINFIPALLRNKRAVHDWICDTHVVLDERSVHQRSAKIKPGTTIYS